MTRNRKRSISRTCWLLAAASAWLLASCDQGHGETCQVSDDCSSGLTCCVAEGADSPRGTCQHVCGKPDDTTDSGSNMSEDDSGASVDAAMSSEDSGDSDGG